jgi:hypothetical protein
MCFILHMASTARVPRRAWDGNDRRLCVEEIHGVEEDVRAHFSLPEIASIGSSLGCGCGFRSVSFHQGDWPEEWMIQQGECEPPDDHLRDHKELHDLVSSLLSEGHPVELYGCWDGEERDPTMHTETLGSDHLLDIGFWFRHRGLYRITESKRAAP